MEKLTYLPELKKIKPEPDDFVGLWLPVGSCGLPVVHVYGSIFLYQGIIGGRVHGGELGT